MKHAQSNDHAGPRRGERGAALISAVLISMLLLAAGGALILTTGMTAANAVDATAEAQAYYAADAGLQAALCVLRRNVQSSPAGTSATFHNFVCGTASTCTNSGGNLSLWLTYTGSVVSISANPPMSYSVTVTDPSLASTATVPALPYQPLRLLVTVRGYGPKGAVKVLEMMVDRFLFTYNAPAALVLRESQNNISHVQIDPGSGAPNGYSGVDNASPPSATVPAVGVGATVFNGNTDLTVATAAFASENMSTPAVSTVGTTALPWPDFLLTADAARSFTSGSNGLQSLAATTTCPANSQALSNFTFIAGDCSLGPNNSGSGLLVATGHLTLSGGFNFSGLVLILGDGHVTRSGGGGGTIRGGIVAAAFGSTGNFTGVVFDTNGGGGSIVQYDSIAIQNALAALGPRVLGVVEK